MISGSKEWWIVVQSTDMYEAERMLKDYKADLLRATSGTPEYVEAGYQLNRVNSEIHRLAQVQNRASWAAAVRNIYGQEGYEKVRTEKARLEAMA